MRVLDVVGIGKTRRDLRGRLQQLGFDVTTAGRLQNLETLGDAFYNIAVLDDRINVERAVKLLRGNENADVIVILFRGRSIEIRRKLDLGGERPIYIHKGSVDHILRVLGLSLLVRESDNEEPVDSRILRMLAEPTKVREETPEMTPVLT